VAKAFKRRGDRFVAHLDDVEREVVVALLEQTHDFLAPAYREPTGNTFDDLVATLGVRQPVDPGLNDPPDPALERLKEQAELAVRQFDQVAAQAEHARAIMSESIADAAARLDEQQVRIRSEFRRLTEHGLRERKTANLAVAIAALQAADGDKVRLDHAQAQATVVALTDVRLLLGERLGLRTDQDAEDLQDRLEAASDDDPELFIAAYYDFMTWFQESLTQALMA